MRRQVMNSGAKPTASPSTILAPVGGWNTRDPLPNMQSKYAIILDNFFPRTADLQLRKGISQYRTCFDIDKPSRPPFLRLFSYMPQDNSGSCLFAVSDEGFTRLEASPSDVPVLKISSPASNGLWQSTNFSNAGGNWLWCCCGDGVNKARVYNGTTWTILDDTSTPKLDYSTEWIDICNYKRRLWLARRNSDVLYYFDVLAISGTEKDNTLYSLPLGSLWNKGGSILKIMSISIDSGEGSDDLLAIFSTEGQVCLYKGDSPTSADTWFLIGVFDIPRPISGNCFVKYGGDIGIMTENGLVAFTNYLQTIEVKRSILASDVIREAWLEMVERMRIIAKQEGKTLQEIGKYCSICLYGEQNMLICNFLYDCRFDRDTQKDVFTFVQFVMNTDTGAWCRFKNLNLTALVNHRDSIYCTRDRFMYKFWEGTSDNGAFITGMLKTAYFFPSGRGTNSRITLIRPVIQSTIPHPKFSLAIDSDYEERTRLKRTKLNDNTLEVGIWDETYWDEAYWNGRGRVSQGWCSVNHYIGKAISVRMRIKVRGQEMSFVSFDTITQSGGMI